MLAANPQRLRREQFGEIDAFLRTERSAGRLPPTAIVAVGGRLQRRRGILGSDTCNDYSDHFPLIADAPVI